MTDQDPNERPTRASDIPLDLAKERETFVRQFLKKGVEVTETLIAENAQLRKDLDEAELENARLRAQVASDNAIHDLLQKIEGLEAERNALIAKSKVLEEEGKDRDGQQAAIEQEVNDLANLYIASRQLHAATSVRRVIRHLCDMCGQLVGGYGFAVYVISDDGKKATPISQEGLEGVVPPAEVIPGEGPIGDPLLTGLPYVREAEGEALRVGSFEDPVAAIPLMVDGKAIGVIAIVTLLEQKSSWASVDRELLQLLGAQAGIALIAANLYAATDGPIAAARGLRDKL